MERIRSLVRDIPNFPKPGVLFRDITPVLAHPHAFRDVIEALAARYRGRGITKVAGIESRGFIIGAALAYEIKAGLVLLRKAGKLPRATFSESYALEYGEAALHLHQDALEAHDRVVVIDDLIATGGTACAAVSLVRQAGAALHELAALIEIKALAGRAQLGEVPVFSLITY